MRPTSGVGGLSRTFWVMVVLIGAVVVMCWVLVPLGVQGLDVGVAFQVSVLGIAAAVAAWYAEEAFQTRKLLRRPHVYLKQDRTPNGKRDPHQVHAHNAGPGVAYNVRLKWRCPEPDDGPHKFGRLCPTEDSQSISGEHHNGALLMYCSEFRDESEGPYTKHTTEQDETYWYPGES